MTKHSGARRTWTLCLSLLVLVSALALGLSAGPRPASPPVQITVSAAASLKEALTAIERDFEHQQKNATSALNFGASGALELQIEQGAPVDVFISASSDDMDKLGAKKLLRADTRFDLLRNELVLIVPRDSNTVGTFTDLKRPDVHAVALGDPRTVPAGDYARQVLTALGLYDALKAKLVFATDVRQVLADVETASAEAGFVYATDAAISPRVRVLAAAPPGTHRPIVYPAAILRDAPHPDAARAFLDYLRSPSARAIFEKAGFQLVAK